MRHVRRVFTSVLIIFVVAMVAMAPADPPQGKEPAGAAQPPDAIDSHVAQRTEALNRLRNEINATYGFRNGVPRINLGPCGRFAKAFREQWNARFREKVTIAFIMARDWDHCYHVLIKLPDGNYFDGGDGVITDRALLMNHPESRIEEMADFDLKLLDKRSYGLNRAYKECPNYSDEVTARLIERHLAMLPKDIQTPPAASHRI